MVMLQQQLLMGCTKQTLTEEAAVLTSKLTPLRNLINCMYSNKTLPEFCLDFPVYSNDNQSMIERIYLQDGRNIFYFMFFILF